MPAMKALAANAVSFVATTERPAAAVARSDCPTMAQVAPTVLRRSKRRHSSRPTAMQSVNHRKPTSETAMPGLCTAKFSRAPGKPLLNKATWIAAASPSVITARSTPLRRRAGTPTTTPTGTAATPPRSNAASIGTWVCSAIQPTVHPPTPAKLTWQSDTIRVSEYRKPTERAMIAVMIALVARKTRKSLMVDAAPHTARAMATNRTSAGVIPGLGPALP